MKADPVPAARRIWHRVEAALLRAAMGLLRRLGPARSSDLGGWIGRTVGPHLSVTRIGDENLRRAMPELDAAARAAILRATWDNLGRTVAELPHLPDLVRTPAGPGWEVEGEEHIRALTATGTPALFFSGHFSNWELMLPAAAKVGIKVFGIYRAASNPHVDAIMVSLRQAALGPGVSMFPKGAAGARSALAHLRQGGSLGLLVDQKMNDGIAVPFFGHSAMTAPAMAQFALRFGIPLMPGRVDRIGPARFRMVCEPPLPVAPTGDRAQDIFAVSLAMNQTLERWIRANPPAWLWLHRRWPKGTAIAPADAAVRENGHNDRTANRSNLNNVHKSI